MEINYASGSITDRQHPLPHLRSNQGPISYRERQNVLNPETTRKQDYIKSMIVKELDITKNPNLYSFNEL